MLASRARPCYAGGFLYMWGSVRRGTAPRKKFCLLCAGLVFTPVLGLWAEVTAGEGRAGFLRGQRRLPSDCLAAPRSPCRREGWMEIWRAARAKK